MSNDVNKSNSTFECAEDDTNNVPSVNNAENISDSTQVINLYSNVVGYTINNTQVTAVQLQDMLEIVITAIWAEEDIQLRRETR